MRHVRLGVNAELAARDSGERVCVLVGRHASTGGAKQHTVAIVELAPGGASDPHLHKAREESYYIVAGRGVATIGGQTVEVMAGDLLFTKPGEGHAFRNSGEAPMRYLVVTAPAWSPEDSFA